MSWLGSRGLGVLIGLAILLGVYLYIRYQRTRPLGDGDGKPLWRGGVTFTMDDLEEQKFPDVTRKHFHFPLMGGTHRAYGRLEVTQKEIRWRSGLWWSLGQSCAKGSFQLSWDEIGEITLSDKPVTISSMGGFMNIVRQGGGRLRGEYLGDPGTVRRAIDTGMGQAQTGKSATDPPSNAI